MESRPLFRLGTALGLAALLSMVTASAAASQEGTALTVTLQRNGQALNARRVALYHATGIKQATMPTDNTATFPADAVAASLEGKSVEVLVDERDDGTFTVHLVQDDPNVLPPPEEDDSRRRRFGVFLFRRGATIVVDIGLGTAVDTSSSAPTEVADPSREGGFDRLSFFTLGGSSLGLYRNISDADPVLRTRYGNANYDEFRNTFGKDDWGWGVGAGVRWSFTKRVGVEVDFVYQDLGEATLSTAGRRTAGSLEFSLDAEDRFTTRSLVGGVALSPAEWLSVTVFAGQTWWKNSLRITDSLRGLVPQVQLQGGVVTEERTGTDPTFGGRVSIPLFKFVNVFYQFNHTKFRGAHVADGPSALPEDISQASHLTGFRITVPAIRK